MKKALFFKFSVLFVSVLFLQTSFALDTPQLGLPDGAKARLGGGGVTGRVRGIAFSPDGLTLASGSYDATIYLWDTGTGEHKRTLTGHTRNVESVAFSPDGETLASGSHDATIRLWEYRDG